MSLLCQLQMTLLCGFQGVFGVTVRLMSDRELRRLEVVREIDRGNLPVRAAAQLLGVASARGDGC